MNILLMVVANDYNKNVVKDIEIEYIEDENGRLIYSKNIEKKKKEKQYVDYKQKCLQLLISLNQGFANGSWAEYMYKNMKISMKSDKEIYEYLIKTNSGRLIYSENVVTIKKEK